VRASACNLFLAFDERIEPARLLTKILRGLPVQWISRTHIQATAKMPIFMNPFQKHDVSDFPDVYVPLAHATRNPSVVAANDDKVGSISHNPKLDDDIHGSPPPGYSANTVEGLRAEIDNGMRRNVACNLNFG